MRSDRGSGRPSEQENRTVANVRTGRHCRRKLAQISGERSRRSIRFGAPCRGWHVRRPPTTPSRPVRSLAGAVRMELVTQQQHPYSRRPASLRLSTLRSTWQGIERGSVVFHSAAARASEQQPIEWPMERRKAHNWDLLSDGTHRWTIMLLGRSVSAGRAAANGWRLSGARIGYSLARSLETMRLRDRAGQRTAEGCLRRDEPLFQGRAWTSLSSRGSGPVRSGDSPSRAQTSKQTLRLTHEQGPGIVYSPNKKRLCSFEASNLMIRLNMIARRRHWLGDSRARTGGTHLPGHGSRCGRTGV